MDWRLRRSRYRFACSMSSILNKYNFAFEDDIVVSIKSLTYQTQDGPRIWGEDEMLDVYYKNYVQFQEHAVQKQNSDFEEDSADDQTFEEGQFTNLNEESQLSPDSKRIAELTSVKCQLANIHIQATKPRSIVPMSPLQERKKLENKPLIGCDTIQRKHLSLGSPELSISAASHSMYRTIVPQNQSLPNNGTGQSSFLEIYESADENCSWNNVTIADLYPEMVKTLSKLFDKVSQKSFSNSLTKRYKYRYCHSKKAKCNTNTEKTRKSRILNLTPGFITEKDKNKKLSIGSNGNRSPLYNSKCQIECSEKNIYGIESSVSQNSDRRIIDCSGIAEDYSYSERTRKSVTEKTFFPSTLCADKTFLVNNTTCLPLSSNNVKKNQSFEDFSHIFCTVDLDTTFNPTAERENGEQSTMAFKTTSSLSLSLNGKENSILQGSKSPVKTGNGLKNHEIKTFTAPVSRPRSHSFSSFHVNRSPIFYKQKYEDAFEKLYKKLCSPKPQKPFKFSNIYGSPRNSPDVHLPGLDSLSSNFPKKANNPTEDLYQKLCSKGFPKFPTFLRAANLKKYEGVQISETVNALVNSPIRTLPAVARIKRAAHFCNEDTQYSPLKRLKNTCNSYKIYQNFPGWKNIRNDATFTLHSPVKSSVASNMDYGGSVSSGHGFLATSVADLEESGISDVNENIPRCLRAREFSRKSQNFIPRVSRKLNYNDGTIRSRKFIQKDYEETFLEEFEEKNDIF